MAAFLILVLFVIRKEIRKLKSNPYKTPDANVEIVDDRPGKPVKAVILASLFDIVMTNISGFLGAIVFGVLMASQGMGADEIMQISQQLDYENPLYLMMTAVGMLITGIGGYMCAQIAKEKAWYATSAYIMLMAAFGYLMSLTVPSVGIIESIVGSIGTIMLGLLGAWISVNRRQRTTRRLAAIEI